MKNITRRAVACIPQMGRQENRRPRFRSREKNKEEGREGEIYSVSEGNREEKNNKRPG